MIYPTIVAYWTGGAALSKEKVSMTIEVDALKMLSQAADQEHANLSEMAERSIRHFCIDYQPHTVEVDILDNGNASIRLLDHHGKAFYTKRGTKRYTSVGIQGTITINTRGPIRTDKIAQALRSNTKSYQGIIVSGRPIHFRSLGMVFEISNFPLKAENDPAFIKNLAMLAADKVENLEITSFREIGKRRCPECNTYMLSMSVWAPNDKVRDVEWVCGLGHRTGKDGAPIPEPRIVPSGDKNMETMNLEPLTGWPTEVLPELEDLVQEIAADDNVTEFYIGRSNDPEAQKSRHGSDDIIPIYQSDSPDNAMDIERSLIKTFHRHKKCSNKAADERGAVSPEDIQYVYVAVWC